MATDHRGFEEGGTARTTPPRPADIAAVFPRLAPLARTATRLHPRPGSPSRQDSSVGGPLLWPATEPWPHCDGPHRTSPLLPLSSPSEVRLQREMRAAARNRPAGGPPHIPRMRASMYGAGTAGDGTGRPPAGPIPLLALAQLYVRDVPALRPTGGSDLLQVLWCPFDHRPTGLPRTELVWRSASDVTEILTAPPEPTAVQYDDYVPEPCLVTPERVTEYPVAAELDPDLRARLRAWSTRREPGAEDTYYDRELSVSPGWKVGGHAPWSATDPFPLRCSACGSRMRPMLTIASYEWQPNGPSWIPYQDRAAAASSTGYPAPATPTMISLAGGYHQQIYTCPASPEHPHAALLQ
ncbi:hypothetical protein [Kitasatospora sp. NPDC059571]|uniref:hypothetical protein n=1 Tax=Kitasatospora sp. NPDC059571 TaxID=3346871 RepID=UPI0036B8BB47